MTFANRRAARQDRRATPRPGRRPLPPLQFPDAPCRTRISVRENDAPGANRRSYMAFGSGGMVCLETAPPPDLRFEKIKIRSNSLLVMSVGLIVLRVPCFRRTWIPQ